MSLPHIETYACMHAYMYVFIYVCIYVYIYMIYRYASRYSESQLHEPFGPVAVPIFQVEAFKKGCSLHLLLGARTEGAKQTQSRSYLPKVGTIPKLKATKYRSHLTTFRPQSRSHLETFRLPSRHYVKAWSALAAEAEANVPAAERAARIQQPAWLHKADITAEEVDVLFLGSQDLQSTQ